MNCTWSYLGPDHQVFSGPDGRIVADAFKHTDDTFLAVANASVLGRFLTMPDAQAAAERELDSLGVAVEMH